VKVGFTSEIQKTINRYFELTTVMREKVPPYFIEDIQG